MYKLKYYSLTNKEKYQLKNNFYQTEFGKSIDLRLKRVFIIGIIAFFFGIFLIITKKNIWDIITAISLLLASFLFIFGSFKIRINKLNDFLIKQKKK